MRLRIVAILAALAALTALVSGCGSSGAKSNGVENKSATEIVNAALAAAKTAKTVHVSGTINTGSPIKLDLDLARGVGGKGSITTNGTTFQVVSVGGKLYLKADAAALTKLGNAAVAQLLAGKWFVAPASLTQLSSISNLTDLTKLFTAALDQAGRNLEKGDTTKVDGQPAIAVKDTKNNGTLYVATTGQPYPLEIAGANPGKQGSVSFTDWDQSVDITAPPNPVDISKLVGG